MKNLKTTLIALGILVLSLVTNVNAQYGYDPMMEDPMAGMERLMQEGDAMAQMQYPILRTVTIRLVCHSFSNLLP